MNKIYAISRVTLDQGDGSKIDYGKFGDLLTEVKGVHGRVPLSPCVLPLAR